MGVLVVPGLQCRDAPSAPPPPPLPLPRVKPSSYLLLNFVTSPVSYATPLTGKFWVHPWIGCSLHQAARLISIMLAIWLANVEAQWPHG